MSRRRGLANAVLLLISSSVLLADDQALWREYGLVHSETSPLGRMTVTSYQLKDPTGALAAWEWLRSPEAHACDLAPFCSQQGNRTVVSDFNYVLVFDRGVPTKADVSQAFKLLPNKRDSSMPAILTFLPQQGLVPNSARYVLGSASLNAFAPELSPSKPGFESGAEAQIADYRVGKANRPVRLVIFNYPTPEMARMHAADFKRVSGAHVKRSGVLVAVILPPAGSEESDTLLSRIQYEAKITWNDSPPPSPIKPLYRLLVNIIYLSIVLSALCLLAGLMYAGMRIYRRRYGSLESEEAMTTLHLTRD